MARPRKAQTTGTSSDGRDRTRPRVIAFRVDDAEREAILERADEVGLSAGDFCRGASLGRKPIGVRAKHRVPSRAEKSLAELARAVSGLIAELNKQGSNVNQLAHIANSQEARGEPVGIDRTALAALGAAIEAHLATAKEMHRNVMAATRLDAEGGP